jgi:hypothetical protein
MLKAGLRDVMVDKIQTVRIEKIGLKLVLDSRAVEILTFVMHTGRASFGKANANS